MGSKLINLSLKEWEMSGLKTGDNSREILGFSQLTKTVVWGAEMSDDNTWSSGTQRSGEVTEMEAEWGNNGKVGRRRGGRPEWRGIKRKSIFDRCTRRYEREIVLVKIYNQRII